MRVTPVCEGIVVSPADGRVSLVTQAVPPAEWVSGNTPLVRISIFMSVFNCHVNRSPVAGRVDRIAYHPGKFLNAELDKASEDNERNALVISTPSGRIGRGADRGLVARRIVCFVREGQNVGAGEAFRTHSLRLAARRVPARRRQAAGSCRADRDRGAKPFWPISSSATAGVPTALINHWSVRARSFRHIGGVNVYILG